MTNLSNEEYILFQTIVKKTPSDLHNFLYKILLKYYQKENIINKRNSFLVAKGTCPVALIAHLDTVFPRPPKNIFYDKEKNVIWSPEGLGADDRAGVFGILNILAISNLRPYIIFTHEEETGGRGARELINRKLSPDIKYLIELDRAGATDCVFYNCDNPEFTDYISKFGFIEDWGTFSDISILAPAWKIGAVNLSIGYHNEHSLGEIFNVTQYQATIAKVINLLKDAKNLSKRFEYVEYVALQYRSAFIDRYGCNCRKCNTFNFYEDMHPVNMPNNITEMECINCLCDDTLLEFCDRCGYGYDGNLYPSEDNLCPKCSKEFPEVMNGITNNN